MKRKINELFSLPISWRAYKIIQRIPVNQRDVFEMKLLASDYLQQRTSFMQASIRQEWKGNYLASVDHNHRTQKQKRFNENFSILDR